MIRKRDFILYILVFAFLLLAIIYTISRDTSGSSLFYKETALVPGAENTGASLDEKVTDRNARLASLRQKIKDGEGQILSQPPVMTSVDDAPMDASDPEEILESEVSLSSRSPSYCFVSDGQALINGWPDTQISLSTTVETRQVTAPIEVSVSPVGTTTASTTPSETHITQHVFMTLPVSPVRGLSSHCIDMPVVGIATDGSLILNNEAWRFTGTDATQLIGYARDGFPIYGSGVDESVLDSCGGYDTGSGYQYHMRVGEEFILGCFAALPQLATLPYSE